jgi:branched-chain amino acid transport system substrate-binding protein
MLLRVLLISLSFVISSAYAAANVNIGVIYDPKDPQQIAAYQGAQLAVLESQKNDPKSDKSDYKFTLVPNNTKAPVVLSLDGNAQVTTLAPAILNPQTMATNSVLISASATSVALLQQYPQHYFSVSASDTVLAGAAAQFIFNQLHRERAMVLFEYNQESTNFANYFTDAFKHINGEVVFNEPIEGQITPELVEGLHTARGRVIYLAANAQQSISAIKQLRQAGVKLPIILSADLVSTPIDKSWADGVFYTTQTYLDKNFESDEMASFLKLYNEQYKAKPKGTNVVLGYDAALLAITAVRNANSTDPQKITAAIKNMKMFPAASGLVNFSALTPLKVVTIVKLTNGKASIAAMSMPQHISQN